MPERRQHESLMTGAEIENLFNDSTVRELEATHARIISELKEIRSKLKNSDDLDEQEELKEKLSELREQDRLVLEAMRKAQNKFPTIDQLKKSA